ncbi:MAG: hypothetical protein QNJ98_16180 [Planctomycetota bacterium]|nr:hypothetical protein [Planctomycetota bacterium]
MRTLTHCLLVATVVLIASPSAAFAHGGVYRGPSSGVPPGIRGGADPMPPPPPAPPCWCATHSCTNCTTGVQRKRSDLALAAREIREVGRIGDLRELEVTVRLRAKKGSDRREAVVPLHLGSLCWIEGASLTKGEMHLTAQRAPRKTAVERYRETIRQLIDPLVVLRVGPGRLDVRAWPVTDDEETVARLRVCVFSDEVSRRTRVYRHGAHALAVVPKGDLETLDLASGRAEGWTIHADRANGRAFVFLPWRAGLDGRHAAFPKAPVHVVRELGTVRAFLDGTGDSAFVAVESRPAPVPTDPPPPTESRDDTPTPPAPDAPVPPPSAEITAAR